MGTDKEKTLKWLTEISEQAMTEAREGNTALINKITKNAPGVAYYLTNVHARPAMTAEQFASQMPQMLKEADELRVQYETLENAQADHERLNNIEKTVTKKFEAELKKLPNLLKEALAELLPQMVKEAVEEAQKETPVETETEADDKADEAPAKEA